MEPLTHRQKEQIATSYFNLLAYMLRQPALPSEHVRCLIRWALQLGLKPDLLLKAARTSFDGERQPTERRDKLRAVFHLVYMTCLDQVIEDSELQVAQLYADFLGLEESAVSSLFQSITTADYDELSAEEMEEQIITVLEAAV